LQLSFKGGSGGSNLLIILEPGKLKRKYGNCRGRIAENVISRLHQLHLIEKAHLWL
jgi:hypothetical protein